MILVDASPETIMKRRKKRYREKENFKLEDIKKRYKNNDIKNFLKRNPDINSIIVNNNSDQDMEKNYNIIIKEIKNFIIESKN